MSKIRTRFAPSPTGLMHLGNIRTALMNYLLAQQKDGTFILRIEDTDQERNFDPNGKKIIEDLTWLGLTYDEGPGKAEPYPPYFQSQRLPIYQEKLKELHAMHFAYRCFCTEEELDRKRERQKALKLPPRYDGTCTKLSEAEATALATTTPFIWRMKLDPNLSFDINDLARGSIHFELKNFSDFPLTRQDGSFTFMFANFVDDLVMKITHVFRGEDHLSNTAGQAAMYAAFKAPLPTFWHMPMLCNIEGKKLSKRDFGFSLDDLRHAGYLPEALCNYLGIIGSGSFKQELMTLEELAQAINFDHIGSTGHVRYDVEKLTWVNHKWIDRCEPERLTELCLPFLISVYPQAATTDKAVLTTILQQIKTDLQTLQDSIRSLAFYFAEPTITRVDISMQIEPEVLDEVTAIVAENLTKIDDAHAFVDAVKNATKQKGIKLKEIFSFLRLALTGAPNGPAIHDLIEIMGTEKAKERIKKVL